jgi:radical SAM superfamily enzyme YgiQ (UPF0313 family)
MQAATHDVVLATLNARWIHAAFGLRYLRANLGELRPRSALVEQEVTTRPLDVVERILQHRPRIVGLGVYIWNVAAMTEVVRTLALVAPEVRIVLGGPEVSHETAQQPIVAAAHYVIRGEADVAFAALCRCLLAGDPPAAKIIDAPPPDLAQIELPYQEYDDHDVAHRVIYVEASRGCPFTCDFCLSALDERVRPLPLAPLLASFERLLARGVRHFKFVDRTFNLGLDTSLAILEFFRARWRDGLLLHFEMIPDRLPERLRDVIAGFPPGGLQFEVGVQTFDEAVAARIHRRQDNRRIEANLRFLRAHTGVHVHADLIAGLPGEDLATFAAGFDRLLALDPQEIQVGILKRLRGAPIAAHDAAFAMRYGSEAPYEVLATSSLDFGALQRLRRFARYFDLVRNSGTFLTTAPLLWRSGSPFHGFLAFSDWLHARTGVQHGIALHRLAGLLFTYLTEVAGVSAPDAGRALWQDFQRTRPNDWPAFLRPYAGEAVPGGRPRRPTGGKRQARHLA